MAEIEWTKSQLAAINVKAPKILVSAAAGSGKSTVLTERIISNITSKESPYDISKILAVTFTKAAAEELKAKISKAVRQAVLKSPSDKRMSGQLIKLSSAKISTIHSLCLTLIKSHFQMLGLNAGMRIADETEALAIRNYVLNELLEDAYSGLFSPIPSFDTFVENFINERDDKISKIVLDAYDKIKNLPNGFDDWEDTLNEASPDTDFGKTSFGKIIFSHLKVFTEYASLLCQSAIEQLRENSTYSVKYLPYFTEEEKFLSSLAEAAEEQDYIHTAELLKNYSQIKLGSVEAELKTDFGEYCREVIKPYFKKEIEKFRDKYFSFSKEDVCKTGEKTVKISKAFIDFLKEFDKRFSTEKLRRCVLDYNDLEHYALMLLYNPDGSVSDNARRISSSLDEIYVDEYQDINPLQNKIFEALSVCCPIFMVGDIKQSIYSFRGAMPSIFADYRRQFAEYDENSSCENEVIESGENCNEKNGYGNVVIENSESCDEKNVSESCGEKNISENSRYEKGVTVFLSDNFRSVSTVTEFANTVSDALFATPEKNPLFDYRIPYSKSDRLICKKKSDSLPNEVQILIAEPDKVSKGEGYYLEAEMVANKISSLIKDGADISNIAILLRSKKTAAPVFEAALKRRNIPVSSENSSQLFDAPEIQLAMCLLNCVDNPYLDIFLMGALRSPVFGFTLDEIITLKKENEGEALFDALKRYTVAHNFEKGVYFLEFLSRIRRFAEKSTVDRVLWQIYKETSFFTLIYDGGAISKSIAASRRQNLLSLHKIAKSFSESGNGDLYSFIERIRLMLEGDNTVPAAKVSETGVKIMSIHMSKGLEFEHCFVCGCSHAFSTESHKSALIVDSELGMAMRIKDELCLTASDTPYRLALLLQSDINQAEEEMRMLYVALTRAKSNLYVTASVKSFDALYLNACFSAKLPHPMLFMSQKNYIKWIITALKCETDLAPRCKISVLSENEISTDTEDSVLPEELLTVSPPENNGDADEIYEALSKRFNFKYPHSASAKIPSKLSVSRLYPEVLDSLSIAENIFSDNEISRVYDLSEFMPTESTLESSSEFPEFDNFTSQKMPSENTPPVDNSKNMKVPSFLLDEPTVTGAEKGTATHIFMQFCDFDYIEKNGIEAEIKRLTEKRFILPAHAELIDISAIQKFLKSEIYKEMKTATSTEREYRFNIKLPASDFTSNEELKRELENEFVFVQGVIDCYFRDENGNIILLDYKTDRVPMDVFGDFQKENRFFTERYSLQLKYYQSALEKLTGKRVYKTLIYSFALGRCIELT